MPVVTMPVSAQDNGQLVNLHMAALQGNATAIQQHLAAGSDLNTKDAYGSTPLIIAITFGNIEAARLLIQGGADLSMCDNNGSSPLHLAVFFGYPEIVQILLDNGADKYLRNHSGATAMDIALTPFKYDRAIYAQLGQSLAPLGISLDYDRICRARHQLATMLRPTQEELDGITYAPVNRPDWEVSTPEAEGFDPALISELFCDAAHSETLRGLIVVKNGHLIAEGYFNDGALDQQSRLASVTKSVTSALTGIALREGYLTSLDAKMLNFFPEIGPHITDPRKQTITIRQMLEMRGGYPWEETDTTLWKGLLSGHYIPLIEDFPLVNDPGKGFNYSNLTSNWLGIILARASGMDFATFGDRYLFSPLGMHAGEWSRDADGYTIGCGTLHLTTRDAAKFGLLYLNHGVYRGEQIIPAAWVTESLQSYSDSAWIAQPKQYHAGRYFRELGYGYQWWSAQIGDRRLDFAWGHGGQLIVLIDDLKMVIVATSYPFHLQHDAESWRYEQGTLNIIGKFLQALPKA